MGDKLPVPDDDRGAQPLLRPFPDDAGLHPPARLGGDDNRAGFELLELAVGASVPLGEDGDDLALLYIPDRLFDGGGVPLAAPIQKGGKAVSRLTGFLVRQLTLILIIATVIYVTYTFWRASPPYGDIVESFQQRPITQTLAAYLSCVAIFLLFEFISLLWAMTRTRVRNGLDSWKEDSGRGLTSFIIVFAASYVCFLFSGFIPESPEAVYGIKGAMEVYGSMHNVLLGLCAAGVISCLVRKYKPY